MIERVVLVGGTRPEFVKLNPLARALVGEGIPTLLITTEQHWSVAMKDAFLRDLRWPCEIASLGTTARSPLPLLGEICARLPAELRPGDMVIAEGDTTSVLGASLVANKLLLRLGHLEAGLRSYDPRMPEEHNRRLCDHIADDLYAPTEFDAAHLREERCPGRTYITGNTVLDAVRQNIARAPKFGEHDYVLVTVHRQENVDDEGFLSEVIRTLGRLEAVCVFPVHPRTEEKLRHAGLWDRLQALRHVRVLPPLDYLSFLGALRDAAVIVTDSGGIQEEATAPEIRRPTIVLRRSTERVPAIDAGYSVLAPCDAARIAELVGDRSWFHPADGSPFGDGHAAEAIVRTLMSVVAA